MTSSRQSSTELAHRTQVHGETIVAALAQNARRIPDRTAMRWHRDGHWEAMTWCEYRTAVGELLAGLAELGVNEGDFVAILAGNRVEWHLADQAILSTGAVTVPVYQTNSAAQVAYVLGHSEARVCFVDTDDQLAKVLHVRDQLPKLDHVVVFEPSAESLDEPFVIALDTLRDTGRVRLQREPQILDERSAAVRPDQLATLVYTSGTTGPPKGTMISHANIMWTLRNSTEPFEIHPGERLLSFLPLSHIAERMMSDFAPVAVGGETWFARSLSTVAEDLKFCRPTVFFAVPRVWEKLHDAVLEKLAEAPLVQRQAVNAYVALGRRKVAREQEGRPLDAATSALYRVLDRLIGAKMRHELGLDAAHVLITAAAPVHPDLLRWFHAVGLPVLELYGQTEDCGPTTANLPWHNKIGTVGPPIPGVSIRTADDGEVLVKGGNVCMGYYKDDAATVELVDDEGWMHTGDVGTIDDDGFLRITGRKKDLIITAAGKNIAPQDIELDLRYHPLISQAVLIGEGRRYLTALITLDADELESWADEHGKVADYEALAGDPDVLAALQSAVDQVNATRSHVENIRKWRVLPNDLTVAQGELTPTLKVKRNVVNDKYADLIEDMYMDTER
jgi:long-chain acyl-CoA synthetase